MLPVPVFRTRFAATGVTRAEVSAAVVADTEVVAPEVTPNPGWDPKFRCRGSCPPLLPESPGCPGPGCPARCCRHRRYPNRGCGCPRCPCRRCRTRCCRAELNVECRHLVVVEVPESSVPMLPVPDTNASAPDRAAGWCCATPTPPNPGWRSPTPTRSWVARQAFISPQGLVESSPTPVTLAGVQQTRSATGAGVEETG